MTYRGQVKNGQITLDEPARLPEGARVNVEVVEEDHASMAAKRRQSIRDFPPIEMPGGPLSDDIVRDRR
jgi:hypothetical protein